ncbi:pseudouridine synthase [Olivibacter sp. XZL3]|uniref:pseudouridine synthase n=1 Tax=Olivibacter sp. XZL3 TaxID=1735116 RepID=UPI0010668C71|nr:pseudouridine synthase [Olivibacter sp. XZL3]
MPFSNKRNSRDDKSAYSKRSSSQNDNRNSRDDKSTYQKRSSSQNDNRNSRDDKSTYQKRSSSQNDNRNSRDDKSTYQKRSSSWNDERNRRDDKSAYSKRSTSRNDDTNEYKNRTEKSSFSKKPYNADRKYSQQGNSYSDGSFTDKADRYNNNKETSHSGNRRNTNNDRSHSPERKYQGKPSRFRSDNFAEGPKHRLDEKAGDRSFGKPRRDRSKSTEEHFSKEREDKGLIRLNRYIANSGVCSRRKADELIQAGVVTVNGVVVTELGTKVDAAKDEIKYNGEKLKREKMVYVLLNKPKDYITTTEDPQERKTVMHLVEKASKERIYPVGRLDRNTTGLLLLTNDGNLAEKLSHPRNNIMKIYHVELNKSLTQGDFNKIGFGIELEDGFIKPDDVSYIQGASKREVGIQIHSGRNRIVRRIFESLGYDVVKLDRVIYANLTKKDLPRGRWRYLEEKEIIQLKHLIK